MKKQLALALAAAMVISMTACGNSSSTTSTSGTESGAEAVATGEINVDTSEDAITDLVTYETAAREVESFNVLYSQNATDFYVITNFYDGLLTNDTKGNLQPCLATEWGSDDGGLNWTFKLREGVQWCDVNGEIKADLTATDFLTGLEWVLNAAKNENSNTSMPNDMIVGARTYNDYTQWLVDNGQEADAQALTYEDMLAGGLEYTDADGNTCTTEAVGIGAPDDYTVTYTCTSALPYFDTVATYACLYPVNQGQIDELGIEGFRAVQPDTAWYSGPYLMTTYIQGNEKVFEPNPNWWGNSEYTRFNSVTVKMVDDLNVAYQLYESGEIDQVELGESTLTTIVEQQGEEYSMLSEKLPTKYSYQFHYCFNKNNEDGTPDVNWNTAIANEAFRKSLYYGLDLTNFLKRANAINPLKCENNFYTMSGLVYTSDGTDYTDLVKEKLGLGDYNGETMVRLDADQAASYKAEAIEELTAAGVTFPVEIDYYISSASQTALDSANVLKQCFSDSFGDDYVTLNICTYVSSLTQEVRTPKLASIYGNGWGADYGDPENYLFQETFGDDNAYYSEFYSCINDFYDDPSTAYDQTLIEEYQTFTEMVATANAIVDDNDARYDAFAEAEAYFLEHCLGGLPYEYSISWQLTCVNDYSTINAAYGIQSRRYLNWETNVNGYSTADYEAFAAEYNAE